MMSCVRWSVPVLFCAGCLVMLSQGVLSYGQNGKPVAVAYTTTQEPQAGGETQSEPVPPLESTLGDGTAPPSQAKAAPTPEAESAVVDATKSGSTATVGLGTIDVSTLGGTTLGDKITACFSQLPDVGGVCDATRLIGAQSIPQTIIVPKNIQIKLGFATIQAAETPIFILTDNDQLEGVGHKDASKPSDGTTLKLTGTKGGQAIRTAAWGNGTHVRAGSAANIRIENLEVIGNSTQDNSIGLDLQGMLEGYIFRVDVRNFATGIRLGWETWQWNCDCYNRFEEVEVIRAGIGVDFQGSANHNVWTGGSVQPFVSTGTGFRLSGANNTLYSPDVENFGKLGTALDFVSVAHTVISPWIEAGGTVLHFAANSKNNLVLGGTSASAKNRAVYDGNSSNRMNLVLNLLGTEDWPMEWSASVEEFPQGSSRDYYQMKGVQACNDCGVELQFNNGAAVHTGYSGHAPLTVGKLQARSGLKISGSSAFVRLPDPPAPKVSLLGTNGTQPYEYAVQCRESNGGVSLVSAVAKVDNGPATLSHAAANQLEWSCADGYVAANVLRREANQWMLLFANAPSQSAVEAPAPGKKPREYRFVDYGQPGTPFEPPARNTTGDVSFAGELKDEGSPLTRTIASGSLSLDVSTVAPSTCQKVQNGKINSTAAPGVLPTDVVRLSPKGSLQKVSGYALTPAGSLSLSAYAADGLVSVDVCNPTAAAITPGALTVNWQVQR